MNGALVLNNVVKSFRRFRVVDDVSFTVEKGSFTALLGPNGSGKSTILKMSTNLIQPDSGTIEINGIDVQDRTKDALSEVGCVIDTPDVYQDVSGRGYLRYIASLSGLSSESASYETDRVLEVVKMGDHADRKLKGYSKGMKQRGILAQSLMNYPSLLILDEPTSGLDPHGSVEFGRILSDLNKDGTTILMSSHVLHEVEGLCNNAIIINNGFVVKQGSISDLISRSNLIVSTSVDVSSDVIAALSKMQGVLNVSVTEGGLSIITDGSLRTQEDLVRELVMMGVNVYAVRMENSLEDVFMDLTGGDDR